MQGLLRAISLHKNGIEEAVRTLDGLRSEDEALKKASVSLRARWRNRADDARRVRAEARAIASRERTTPARDPDKWDHLFPDIDPSEPVPPPTDPAAIELERMIAETKKAADRNNESLRRITETMDSLSSVVDRMGEESELAFETLYHHADSLTNALEEVRAKARKQRWLRNTLVSAGIVAAVFTLLQFYVSRNTSPDTRVLVIGPFEIPLLAVVIAVGVAAIRWPINRWFEGLIKRKAEDVTRREVTGYFTQRANARRIVAAHESALRDVDASIATSSGYIEQARQSTS